MLFHAQASNVEPQIIDGTSMITMVLIAMAISIFCTFVLWKLGVIRVLAGMQTFQQSYRDNVYDKVQNNPDDLTDSEKKYWKVTGGKLIGRKTVSTYEFGTGKNAVISFMLIVWLSTFVLTMYGLIMYG